MRTDFVLDALEIGSYLPAARRKLARSLECALFPAVAEKLAGRPVMKDWRRRTRRPVACS